jgi:anti-sigma factor RsiW
MTHQQAIRTMSSERYLLDEMSELERYQFEAHYFDCDECAEDVRLGESIRDEVKANGALLAERPVAAPLAFKRPAWRQASVAIPWAAAAALALTVGYQSTVTVPNLQVAAGPQAVTPVVLRGASRGADPVVKIPANDKTFVTLAPDVMAGPETKALAYDLRGPAQSAVLSGRAPLPLSGAPLMLLIPADRFVGPGSYTLVVRDADRPDTVIGEYRFVAE